MLTKTLIRNHLDERASAINVSITFKVSPTRTTNREVPLKNVIFKRSS